MLQILAEIQQKLDIVADFVEAQEWARYDPSVGHVCIDCGAPKGTCHSERCGWLSTMKLLGRR